MNDFETPQRPRRPRAKNTFQAEIESRLKERRAKGLTADLTSEESEEDAVNDLQFGTLRQQNRPASAKRRGDHASTWQPGLGDTMGTQDIEKLLGRKTPTNFDEEDDEITRTLRGKPSMGLGLSQRKTPTPKDGLLGRKTPTSPQMQELSKEDIIFGRKTPTQLQRGKSPQGASDLPNLGSQQPWQPPNFRNVSPSEQRLSPASQGRRTPGLDSGLDPISETREKTPRLYDKRGSPAQTEESPRSDRPTPRARGRQAEKEPTRPTRTTPTLDLFGKSRRDTSLEVEKELKDIEDKKQAEEAAARRRIGDRKTPTERKSLMGTRSPGVGGAKSPGRSKSPGLERQHSQTGRKTPTDLRGRDSVSGRKSPAERLGRETEKPQSKKKDESSNSLLAFLTGDVNEKPKVKDAQDRPKVRQRQTARSNKIPKDEHQDIYDIGEVPTVQALPPRAKDRMGDESSVCEDLKEDPSAPLRKPGHSADGKKLKQRTDRQQADDAIDKVLEEQNRIDFKPVKKVRPVSAQAKVQHRPKPRYGTLPGQKSKEEVLEFNSTQDIRDAVYEDWYQRRMKAAREEQRRKQLKEEEEAKKKKEAEEEKRTEAMLSYKAWEESKKEKLAKEKMRQKREEEKKLEKERQDREDKRVEAEVTFKSWKEKKDVWLKGKVKQEKMTEREKKELEAEKKAEKEKDSLTAFRGWKKKKDVELHHTYKDKQKQKKEEETNRLALERQKEEEAQLRYEDWMHSKEKQEHRKKIETRRKNMTGEMDFRPAWSPANNTVPFGR